MCAVRRIGVRYLQSRMTALRSSPPWDMLSEVKQSFFVTALSPHRPEQSGDAPAMSEPLVVVIPHRLGKQEALRRIKDGISRAKGEFAWILALEEEAWTGDRLSFRASALGQRAAGFI